MTSFISIAEHLIFLKNCAAGPHFPYSSGLMSWYGQWPCSIGVGVTCIGVDVMSVVERVQSPDVYSGDTALEQMQVQGSGAGGADTASEQM